MKCLNCDADFGEASEQKYCDILCRIAFGQKQVKKYNEEFKPQLTYYEVDKK